MASTDRQISNADESMVGQTSSSTSDGLIRFEPPELSFPLLPNRKVMSSVKIVNVTDYNVGFNTYSSRTTNAAWFHTEPPRGILPPGSTQKLVITREQKEDALEDMQFNHKYFVWNSIVTEGVKDSDLGDYMADQESKELPIVLNMKSSLTSMDLIQLDPAEIRFPILQTFLYTINIVNITDFYVAFNAYHLSRNAARHKKVFEKGILRPRSNKELEMSWIPTETEKENMEPDEDFFVWNRVVTGGVEAEDIIGYMDEEESKEMLRIIDKTSPCASEELIQFDRPELSFPFLPNKLSVSTVDIVNCTDHHVAFRVRLSKSNAGSDYADYYAEPSQGVMPPRSTQRLVLKMVAKEKELGDLQCDDKFSLWNRITTKGVKASDIIGHVDGELTLLSKALPIVLEKTSLSTSNELIQFDPPELCFPFLPNQRVFSLVKVVNVTDYRVGFDGRWDLHKNLARYTINPWTGILEPRSTQTVEVIRVPDAKESEDMQCKDKVGFWNCIVTEGVQVSDLSPYLMVKSSKLLPIVLTKPGVRTSK